jgi:hypothetical protein
LKRNVAFIAFLLIITISFVSQNSTANFSLSKIFSLLTPSQDYTSGRCNRPLLLSSCEFDSSLKFGYYSLIDRNLPFRESFIANITVSYKEHPWRSKNKDQVIELIVVTHAAFTSLNIGFNIGDVKSKVLKNRGFQAQGDLIRIDLSGYSCILKFNIEKKLIKYLVYRNCSENSQIDWFEKSKKLL